MICPVCKSGACRRSRRRSLSDYTLGLAGLRPWRCEACERRFYAWSVPPRYLWYAHCKRCGNMDLQQVGNEYVTEGVLRWLWRWLQVPAYRCQPCRRRFFSMRPFRPIVPARSADEPLPEGTESIPPPSGS